MMGGYVSIGAIPGSAPKLLARAQAGEGQAILPQMFRTRPETIGPTGERNARDLNDVTKNLGLDRVDVQKIQNLISEFDPTFKPKGGNQPSFLLTARLTEAMRRSYKHIEADKRMEIVTRARSYWRNNFAIDNTRVPSKRYGARP